MFNVQLSMFNGLHHCCQEILIAQFLDVVEVLALPGHVVLLILNPLVDELLGNASSLVIIL